MLMKSTEGSYELIANYIFYYGFLAFGALAWDLMNNYYEQEPNYLKRKFTVFKNYIAIPFVLWLLLPMRLPYNRPFYLFVRYGSYLVLIGEIFVFVRLNRKGWRMRNWRMILRFIFLELTPTVLGVYGLSSHFAYYHLVYISDHAQFLYWVFCNYEFVVKRKRLTLFLRVVVCSALVLFAYMGDPYLRPLGIVIEL